jgi:hypothetical protein
MTEDKQVGALTLKLCEAADDSQLGVIMRAFGRMTAILADAMDMPVDEMLQTIVDEATKYERVDKGTLTMH